MIPIDEIEQPATLSLTPYTGTWGKAQAAHLLRRTLFGPTYPQIEQTVNLGMNAAVDQLLNLVPTDPPVAYSANDGVVPIGQTWINSVYPAATGPSEEARRSSLFVWQMKRLNSNQYSIQEKMCLFWQNHFAAEFTFDSRATYQYHELIRTFALGNFKQFVKEMTINPSMLVFLNGASNNSFYPNENYSRELLELYTIGKGPQIAEGDYSTFKESDVSAGAKILTGWMVKDFLSTTVNAPSSYFQNTLHYPNSKTLSEHFGNAVITQAAETEYTNYIDVIFQQPEVAKYICKKLYRWLVNYDITTEVDQTILPELANTLVSNNFEIAPVLSQLLKSEHFYDVAMRGTIIKNPIEYGFSLYNSTLSQPAYSLEINSQMLFILYYALGNLGQDYSKPPSVGGWTAYYQAPSFSRLWANSSYIKLRFDLSDYVTLAGGIDVQGNKFGVDHLAFLNSLSDPSSAPAIVSDMITVFCPKGLDLIKQATLKAILTNNLPDFEWTLQYNEYIADPTNATVANPVKTRVALTLSQLFKMPEFQTI